jgi:hypothetical protein
MDPVHGRSSSNRSANCRCDNSMLCIIILIYRTICGKGQPNTRKESPDNAAVCFKANQQPRNWELGRALLSGQTTSFRPASERITLCSIVAAVCSSRRYPPTCGKRTTTTCTPSPQSVFANKDGYHQKTRVSGSVCLNYSEMNIFSSGASCIKHCILVSPSLPTCLIIASLKFELLRLLYGMARHLSRPDSVQSALICYCDRLSVYMVLKI